MSRLQALAAAACLMAGRVAAQDLSLHGYVDARLVIPADQPGWIDGGLAKSRFGAGDSGLYTGAALDLRWQATPTLAAAASLQYRADGSPKLGLIDAYLRYRPVSRTPWRWSVKVGAFFPAVSLENDGVGWTSRWTITPSAINSWVGEELRIFGAELRLEHRAAHGTLEAGLTAFRANDPAGELLATRGWSLVDATSTLGERLREPDALASVVRAPPPLRFEPFGETDGRTGWQADLGWRNQRDARISLLRYDNRAEPDSFRVFRGRRVFSWHTRFWSLGAQASLGKFTLIGQLMDGGTAFEPAPGRYLDSRFHAGFLLLGWRHGAWSPALRVDMFSVHQRPDTLARPLSEHGHALTAALNWRPNERLRLTAELLRVDSNRDQRQLQGLATRQIDLQLQLNLRLLF